MTAQRGRDLLLKIDDGTGTFVTVAGLRSRQIALNAETVDITDSESAGRWRELLSGAGLKRASINGSGIFKDAASDALVREVFFDGTTPIWQIIVPDFGELAGPFQITALEYSGQHNGEVAFELVMESAGQILFEAA
ncbi:phage major tail protein, TP901-1 family [Salaquimonas pukyongi]|uniref:phage major tail protein, TP901-1 family n=1 Tax=Salaquimonas pukyongi TaxID=2712698 RepID=UPI00096BAC7A|nr:phage major tail protein, TP901-1 family [Salaquimonas pukyongi]